MFGVDPEEIKKVAAQIDSIQAKQIEMDAKLNEILSLLKPDKAISA